MIAHNIKVLMPGFQSSIPLTYEQPSFTFKGDEAFLGTPYINCVNNHYTKIMPGFEAAATAFGPELSPEALERGRRMLSGQFWLDDLIDSHTVERATYEGIIRSLPTGDDLPAGLPPLKPGLTTSIGLLHNAMRPLPNEARKQIVEDGIKIYDLTAEQMAASSMRDYIRARREEGHVAGRLTAHAFGTAEGAVPENFRRWLERGVSYLSLADHASDLSDDFERGATQITPTKWHTARLAIAASRDLLATLTTIKGMRATSRATATLLCQQYLTDS